MGRAAHLAVVAVLVSPLSAGAAPQDASCRNYPPRAVLADIKARVEAMRRLEREAADRLVGLDTRPYEWLRDQARMAEEAIAVPALVAAEKEVAERCRIAVPPLRRDCAAAAAVLVRVVGELVAGAASDAARMAWAQAMPPCEQAVGLKPSDSALRAFKPPPGPADGTGGDAGR